MAKIEFNVDNKKLVIDVNPADIKWCTLFLEAEGKTVKLGSEMYKILKEKLINGLKLINSQVTTLYKGVEVFSIINLSEPHATIAASPLCDEGVELYLLDFDGNFYPFMRLLKTDIKKLISELENFEI